MSRINTMARFEEPEEAKVVAECAGCNTEFHEGEDVYYFYPDYFCTPQCLANNVTQFVTLDSRGKI